MLKLPKGLKKKKKSKKNKELFTEEELEQYKREQKAKQLAEQEKLEQEQQSVCEEAVATTSKPKTDDDEWSKFNQLTTGIDSILKKTQVELNRIKEDSYYQRIEPPKKEVVKSPEKEEIKKPELTEEELEEQRTLAALKEAVVELSDSEGEDDDQANDIFDTNYIDELASGNLALAYVPESPDDEDLGPDPFDTNYAEKVIKGPEVSKRGKKIVNIGSAVEVLTGRVGNVSINKEALKRPRRGPQNLLLQSFEQDIEATDDFAVDEIEKRVKEQKPVLTLLDDSSDIIADIPIDLSASLHLQYLKQKEEEEKEAEKQRKLLAELEKDEFDELAAESLTKKEEVIVLDSSVVVAAPLVEEQNWSEFTKQAELGIVDVYDLDEFEVDDTDPFDTEYVQTVVRENSIEDDDFDPRAGEPKIESPKAIEAPIATLTVKPKDLLSGSTSDLTDLSHIPVIQASESIEQEIDPFDTSGVISLVQPKETEIKFLEKELLSDTILKHSISDPDFDPRSDEPIAQSSNSVSDRKSSLCLNISSAHKTVAFTGQLAVDDNNSDGKKKPVTPYYSRHSIEETADISDSEFDPRAITPAGNNNKTDLLGVGESEINTKVLTPATSSNINEEGMEYFNLFNKLHCLR